MDYTTLPPEIIYRKRRSLEEFANHSNLNLSIVDNMLDFTILQTPDFKNRVLTYLNAAYYICTLIVKETNPEWSLPKYFDIAFCNQKNSKVNQAITLSLVKIYISGFSVSWRNIHNSLIFLLDKYIKENWIEDDDMFKENTSYYEIHEMLNKIPAFFYSININEFTPRIIDNEAIEDIRLSQFTWTKYTEYYNYNIMHEIVFGLGKTEDEMKVLIESFRHDAEDFYSKGYPYYRDTVCSRLGTLEQEVEKHFRQTLTKDEGGRLQKNEDNKPVESRIKELEVRNKELQEQLAQLQTDSIAEIEQYKKEIDDLRNTVQDFQQRKELMTKTKAKRGGMQMGLTPEQSVIFGRFLVDKLDISFSNKKDFAPILNALFGWGTSSLAQKLCGFDNAEDEKYVANIFGKYSSVVAKGIYKNWDESMLQVEKDESPQE